MRRTRVFGFACLFAIAWAGQARAQFDRSDLHRPFELNFNAGGHRFDGSDENDFGLGARMFLHSRMGLSFGGNFTWVRSKVELLNGEQDVNSYYYNAELEYTIPAGVIEPFLGAGAGAQTVKLGDVSGGGTLQLASDEDHHASESETNLSIPLTAGIKVFNGTRRVGFRGEVRDNVVVIQGDEDEGTEDETTHNWEFSGGISFLFGGGM